MNPSYTHTYTTMHSLRIYFGRDPANVFPSKIMCVDENEIKIIIYIYEG
jgi:hypothetical protein